MRVSTSRVYIVNEDESKPTGCANRVRAWLGRYCCDWCSGLPTIALVCFAFLIVLLVLSIVPLAYLLVSLAPAKDINPSEPVGPMRTVDVIRSSNISWPLIFMNDSFYEQRQLAALSTRSLVPPNVTSCDGYGFSCTSNPSIVIGKHQRCDAVPDCLDGSDEVDCEDCQTAFSCALRPGSQQKTCLRGLSLCDGVAQCADGSDESLYCKRSSCKPGEYRCDNSDRCIPNHFRCDGDEHCPSGDDEIGCTACNHGAKFCNQTQTCIPIWKTCNGVADCLSAVDEVNCDCIGCSSGSTALCELGNSSNICIEKKSVCDGVAQCPNGLDEQQCAGSCPDTADVTPFHAGIQCSDGVFYHWKYACSGLYPQCSQYCEECNPEMAFQCADNSNCIHRSKVCDTYIDCVGGSDEQGCTNWKEDCNAESRRCDAFQDCADDGRDEAECDECKAPSIHCKADKKCIPSHQRCDGIEQCSDGSDEKDCACNECLIHPFPMYSCEEGNRCFRMNDVCTPRTRCPDASHRDRMYCATRHHSFF